MTDITLHGTGSELSQRLAEFKEQQLVVTIRVEPAEDYDVGGPEHLRIRDEAHLEALLEEGLASGMEPLQSSEWDEMRRELRDRAAKRQ